MDARDLKRRVKLSDTFRPPNFPFQVGKASALMRFSDLGPLSWPQLLAPFRTWIFRASRSRFLKSNLRLAALDSESACCSNPWGACVGAWNTGVNPV